MHHFDEISIVIIDNCVWLLTGGLGISIDIYI